MLTGTLMSNMVRGYSAYEIAVQNGFEGTVEEWLSSLVGESVQIEVVEDTSSSYILKFTVGDQEVVTPNLRENLNDMKAQITDMQTQVSHLSAEIINLHSTDTSIQSDISALSERVTAVENQLSTIESSLSDLISAHDNSGEAHPDIRSQLSDLNSKFAIYIDSTDVDLDQLSEIVAYMKGISAVEIVDELPSPENADPKKIYILRSQANNSEEVGG